MTKADVVNEIVRVVGTTKREAKLIVETMLDSVVKALKKGGKVEIRGFGSFNTHWRGGRTARNPRTGRKVNVFPRRIRRFRASRALMAILNASADTADGESRPANKTSRFKVQSNTRRVS